ncbi:hypothetical protein B0J12DRAFT_775500 [Macrophomina phaseolina]|uniref:Uncharacterized protein n=1 Tax=Macrophomina phaseolina TaxID=35725 RepID=A0ABQ8FRJ2_9PEZI|nr:hypothetical protein B0J12DRAFT_775500 [Macrophomina phaseolina]
MKVLSRLARLESSTRWKDFRSNPEPPSSLPPVISVEYVVVLRTEGSRAAQIVEERSMDIFVVGESHNYGKVLVWIDAAPGALSSKVQPRAFERVKLCCVIGYERLAEKSRPAIDVNLGEDFGKLEAFMRRFSADAKKGLTVKAICRHVKASATTVEESITQLAEALLPDPATAHLSGQLAHMRAFIKSLAVIQAYF